jgi:hypothetical protein
VPLGRNLAKSVLSRPNAFTTGLLPLLQGVSIFQENATGFRPFVPRLICASLRGFANRGIRPLVVCVWTWGQQQPQPLLRVEVADASGPILKILDFTGHKRTLQDKKPPGLSIEIRGFQVFAEAQQTAFWRRRWDSHCRLKPACALDLSQYVLSAYPYPYPHTC